VVRLKKEIIKRLAELAAIIPDGQKSASTKRIMKILERPGRLFELDELPWLYRDVEPPMKKGENAPPEYINKWKKLAVLARELAERIHDRVFENF